MELNLTQTMREIISAFFLLILPGIVILLGIVAGIEDIVGPGWTLWYFLLSILWFGLGFIFFGALH